MRLACAVMVLVMAAAGWGQGDPGAPNVVGQLTEMTHRSGHSPTTDEIQAAEMQPGVSDPAAAKAAVPLLLKALADPDAAMRRYGLATLVGMQSAADAPAADGSAPAAKPAAAAGAGPGGPAAYKAEVGRALAGVIPAVAKQLGDEEMDNRRLAATVLGGFSVEPPAAVFPPLVSYLRRDDAVGPVGLEVVSALLQLGPLSDETAGAVARYLRRPDQTGSAKAELVEAIAARSNQSPVINQALLGYLDSDDASLRARVILSLPQLELSPEVFGDLKARVQTIAAGDQEALPVVNAAKSIAGCWTAVKMASGCPVY